MAIYNAQHLRRDAAAEGSEPAATAAAVLEALQQEAPKRPYSRVVIVGVVRALEFALLVFAALALWTPNFLEVALIIAVSFVIVALIQALRGYSIAAFRRPFVYAPRLWAALSAVFIAVLAAARLSQSTTAPVWLAQWCLAAVVALTVERSLVALLIGRLHRAGRLERRAVVVGGGDAQAAELMAELIKADPADARIVGVFDDRSDDRSPPLPDGPPKLGNIEDLVKFARAARIELVIFALPISAEKRILEMLRKLWVLPVDIRLAANANRLQLRPRNYSYVGAAPMLDIFDKPLSDWDLLIKALFDRVVGGLFLILLSPVLLAVGIAIKLDSRGPALFRQLRYGFNNELIPVFKFRTLRHASEDSTADKLVTKTDPRVTRIGHFLRRTSLDELPQLFNVIRGDLSLVGPRPHAVHAKAADRQYDEVVEDYFARHRVKPGITGWAQINGWRGETDTPIKIQRRVEHDLYYIENWSLWLDLWILIRTPFALMNDESAY